MNAIFRYTVITLALLVFAIIFMVCVEGACFGCAESQWARSEGSVDRTRSLLARLVSALGVFGGVGFSAGVLLYWVRPLVPERPLFASSALLEVSALRI